MTLTLPISDAGFCKPLSKSHLLSIFPESCSQGSWDWGKLQTPEETHQGRYRDCNLFKENLN